MQGYTDRNTFFAVGLLLAITKYCVDSAIAGLVFNHSWSLENYWAGRQIVLLLSAGETERRFLVWMLLFSIPFVWAGIALIVRRLRSAGLPLWLAMVFFVPIINIMLFILLSMLPTAEPAGQEREHSVFEQSDVAPSSLVYRGLAILTTALVGTGLTFFGVHGMGNYGVGLFASLPFCLGLISALLLDQRGPIGFKACITAALLSVTIAALILFLIAFEGMLCIVMAAPIWLTCAALGGVVGYFIQQYTRDRKAVAIAIVGLTLILPIMMGAEALLKRDSDVSCVRTVLEIDAKPDEVWRRVIAFPRLKEPTEIYFRLGVAYPTDATIVGYGVGAERRCNFSTGAFVEPIEIWDEPHLLKFSVTHNPPPLRELSFYREIHPPHLDGFLVSRAGQFRLTPLAGGKTLLEGTTWYQNDMGPSAYWRLWSDAIIHRIHLRVLRHIKQLSESAETVEAFNSEKP